MYVARILARFCDNFPPRQISEVDKQEDFMLARSQCGVDYAGKGECFFVWYHIPGPSVSDTAHINANRHDNVENELFLLHSSDTESFM